MQQLRRFDLFYSYIFLLVLLSAGYQSRAAAELETWADVLTYDDTFTNTGSICHYSDGLYPKYASCVGSYNFGNSIFYYNGRAETDYGILKVFGNSLISTTEPSSGGPFAITTGGLSQFRDQWSVHSLVRNYGTLEISFDITATYDNSLPFTDIYGGISLWDYTHDTLIEANDVSLPPPGSGTWSATAVFDVPVTSDYDIDFMVTLTGGSILYNLNNGGYDGQGSYLDVSNTAVMSSIVVKDADGNIVPFTLSTVSDAALFKDLAPSTVPVPAASWLFGSGLLGLLGIAKRRRAA